MILCNGRKPKVCIDPGHGGNDPGAVGPGGTREAEIVLAISKEVVAELEMMGIEAYLTREEDNFVQLHERTSMAEGADCFVSVHCNAFRNQNAEGVLSLFGAPGGRNKALANYIQKSMMKHLKGHRDRGIVMSPSRSYPRKLYVLGNAPCPAALIECEFISNPTQEGWLNETDSQRQIAHAIAKGTRSFIRSLPQTEEVDSNKEPEEQMLALSHDIESSEQIDIETA